MSTTHRPESYYLPFMTTIVNQYPNGVIAPVVYKILWETEEVLAGMGPEDWASYGSTKRPRCEQIARNNVSNGSYKGHFEIVKAKPHNLYFPVGAVEKIDFVSGITGVESVHDENEEKFFEGAITKTRSNRRIRNRAFVRAVRAVNIKKYAVTTCECCFDTDSRFCLTERESDTMSVHHKNPLKSFPKTGRYTKITEGCVLCARCHRLSEILGLYDPDEIRKEIDKRNNDRRNKIYRIEEKAIKSHNGCNSVIRRRKCGF